MANIMKEYNTVQRLIEDVDKTIKAIENNEPTARMIETMRSDDTSEADFIRVFVKTGGWSVGVTVQGQAEFVKELKHFKGKLEKLQKSFLRGGNG